MTIDHDAIAARVWQDRETGTPGPWHHDADDQRGIDYTDPRSGTCWSVAYVHSHCGHPIDGSSANAHRIAALPDLEAAYLNLYDEVKRPRAHVLDQNAEMHKAVQDRAQWQTRCEAAHESEGRLMAERDRLRAALNEIATAASGIAHDLQIGPEDEGRDIYDMVLVIRDDARAALKGDSDE